MSEILKTAIEALLMAAYELMDAARDMAAAHGLSPDDMDALEKETAAKRAASIDAARKAELEILGGER